MNISGSFKKENIAVIYADLPSTGLDSKDFMYLVGLERIALHCV